MTTHIRTDVEELNEGRTFACGLGPDLPDGDRWVGEFEVALHRLVDCEGCGGRRRSLGTPISKLSGRPGHHGHERFVEIGRSWGYP